jgi:outer membrane receptor protein involved in Fe transport
MERPMPLATRLSPSLRILPALLPSALALAIAFPAHAQDANTTTTLDRIEVTSNKLPTPIDRATASVTEVTGDELRATGSNDLAGAMRLVAGVDIAPGGDAGPAASVPALWGLREIDAFLLVIDGVPWGGAFQPALASLDLNNIERIEVLRGAAPVSYGATSFVGVIQVIHYAAGTGPTRGEVRVGSRGSFGGSMMAPVRAASEGGFASSLLTDFDRQGFSADRTAFDRAHALFRTSGQLGGGTFGMDIDGSVVNQTPASPHPVEDGVLTARFPLDANINPSDARLDEIRTQIAFNYRHDTGLGEFASRLSFARTDGEVTKGFLRPDFSDGSSVNADGYRQTRHTNEGYFDAHFSSPLSKRNTLVWGLDYLYGDGAQQSDNFEYPVSPDGHDAPVSTSRHTDEHTFLSDRRNFGGIYADWRFDATDAWRIDAGVRFNHTTETRRGLETDLTGPEPEFNPSEDHRHDNRWSGALGSSYRFWRDGNDELSAYASYRNTFKPAAIDFGPEAESDILQPETARSIEAGLKGSNLDGRLEWDASVFRMNFQNLVITQDVNGLPGLTNGGNEHFKGAEVEARYKLADALSLQGTWAWHDARFADSVQLFDDGPRQLRGNFLEASPRYLAGLGLIYYPASGFNGNVVANWVGSRFLDKENTALAGGYATLDAGVGYRRDRWEVRLDGRNLTDRRDPVAASELGEGQYYRLPGRSVQASFRYDFNRAGTQ